MFDSDTSCSDGSSAIAGKVATQKRNIVLDSSSDDDPRVVSSMASTATLMFSEPLPSKI